MRPSCRQAGPSETEKAAGSHLLIVSSLTNMSFSFLQREEAEKEETSFPDSSERVGMPIP